MASTARASTRTPPPVLMVLTACATARTSCLLPSTHMLRLSKVAAASRARPPPSLPLLLPLLPAAPTFSKQLVPPVLVSLARAVVLRGHLALAHPPAPRARLP